MLPKVDVICQCITKEVISFGFYSSLLHITSAGIELEHHDVIPTTLSPSFDKYLRTMSSQ